MYLQMYLNNIISDAVVVEDLNGDGRLSVLEKLLHYLSLPFKVCDLDTAISLRYKNEEHFEFRGLHLFKASRALGPHLAVACSR